VRKTVLFLGCALATGCAGAGQTSVSAADAQTEQARAKAISATRADAERAYGDLSGFTVEAAKEGQLWRIKYLPKRITNGGAPSYLVDERTGVLVSKVYTQ
jgi:hypothetical protein